MTVQGASAGAGASVVIRRAGEGEDYDWENDHIFVKVSSAESNGVLTMVQDNVKPGFNLGLHLHDTHTEIFYILDGTIHWTVGADTFTTDPGAVVYVPGGVPHAARSGTGARMLMFYAPAGFDKMLAEIENAPWYKRYNPIAIANRNTRYDFRTASPGDTRTTPGPAPVHVRPDEGVVTQDKAGSRTAKLDTADTGGLASMAVQRLDAGATYAPDRSASQLEVLYVLDGTVNVDAGGQAHTVTTGGTVYLPAGVEGSATSTAGATLLVYRM
ncbi:MAG: cupin domain-containing protein [Pseudomonadota bacterium]